jgi:HTH-type transcriptional regulator/antitoxin HipB
MLSLMNVRAAKDLGALIRDRRNELGLTQQDLADKTGVSRVWVVALEKGKPSAQLELVLRTLHQLGMAISVDSAKPSLSTPGIDLGEIIRSTTKQA